MVILLSSFDSKGDGIIVPTIIIRWRLKRGLDQFEAVFAIESVPGADGGTRLSFEQLGGLYGWAVFNEQPGIESINHLLLLKLLGEPPARGWEGEIPTPAVRNHLCFFTSFRQSNARQTV
jgi:hypothetical protein